MVKRIIKLLGREISGLHEAAYLLGAFAFLSQILALVRDRMFAHYFGAGETLDIYYAAFRIPDLIFVTVASLVSVSVLIPFFIEKMDKDNKIDKTFINNIFSGFFLLVALTAIVAFFLTPYLSPKLFSAFPASAQEELVTLTRILLLSPILLGISNFFGSITQIYNRFFLYATSPIIYNLGIIVGIIGLYPIFGISGLAWGVVLGALFHMAIQVPFIQSQRLFPIIVLPKWSVVRKVALLSLPRTIALSSGEIAKFVLIIIAALVGVGSVSVFTFSFNLQSVPLSIIGVSYSLAAFPVLSRYYSLGNKEKFIEYLTTSLRHIIFLALPLAALFVVLRAQIVRVVLGSGEFSWSDTRLTAAALAMFVISLVPQCLVLLFARAYYARGNTRKPLYINVVSSLVIIAGAYALLYAFRSFPTFQYFMETLLRVEGIPGTAVLMAPLAYTIGYFINAIWHWYAFAQEFSGFSKRVMRTLFDSLSSAVLMGFSTYILLNLLDDIFDINTFIGIFMQGFLAGIGGIAAGIVVLKLLKNSEIKEIWKTVHRKFWKTPVVGPEPESL